MAPASDSGDYAAMKHVIAIVLLCLSTQLSAGGRCPLRNADRAEAARVPSAKPNAGRVVVARQHKLPLASWQAAILFEQQIL